jgi:hypothetical protein
MIITDTEQFIFPKIEYKTGMNKEKLRKYIDREKEIIQKDKSWLSAKRLFRDKDEKPFIMSPGETAIFKLIAHRQHRFSQILCSTQYGKTFTVSRAVLVRISLFPENWVIVVPDYKRGKILLDYIIQDSADNPYFKTKLVGMDLGDKGKLANLLEERSKLKLTYQIITDDNRIKHSSVRILTTEARKRVDTINAIMGFGARNIIFDESALVSDNVDAGVFRMIAGKGRDTFLCKIGNPFYRNHFYRSWNDPNYKKIFINDEIGLLEGRYDEETLKMAYKKPQYSILFGCEFPSADAVDQEGFTSLLNDDEINLALKEIPEEARAGEKRMGVDVARGGGNYNVFTFRCGNYAYIIDKNKSSDLMDIASQTVGYAKTLGIKGKDVFIDDIGVGGGVTDRCRQLGLNVHATVVSRKRDSSRFYNKRAQNYWRLKDWLKAGGKLNPEDDWSELRAIKYKTVARSGGSQIQIISKDKLRMLGIPSPDISDSLMLTFDIPERNLYEEDSVEEKEEFDSYDVI